jgi:hypothetical protein
MEKKDCDMSHMWLWSKLFHVFQCLDRCYQTYSDNFRYVIYFQSRHSLFSMLVGDDMLRGLRLKAVVTCAEGHLSMFMSMQNQDTSWSSLLCIPFQGSWTSKIKLGGTQIIQIHIRDWQIHMIVVQITYIYIYQPPKLLAQRHQKIWWIWMCQTSLKSHFFSVCLWQIGTRFGPDFAQVPVHAVSWPIRRWRRFHPICWNLFLFKKKVLVLKTYPLVN